jgi:hypothetical protein
MASSQWSEKAVRDMLGFENESNTVLAGPTSSGKTHLLLEILKTARFTRATPKKTFVLVPSPTEAWNDVDGVELMVGKQALEAFLSHSNECPEHSVVIFDDYMSVMDNKDFRLALEHWFTVTTHQRHLWTFFVIHDMFYPSMRTLRANTQNFILFDILSNNFRSAQDFITRLLGPGSGSSFMSLWKYAVEDKEKGWIRLDQKIQRGVLVKTVVSTGGVTYETALIAARSSSLTDPLFIDSMAPPDLSDNPKYQIPPSLFHRVTDPSQHGSAEGDTGTSGSVPGDRSGDLQQPDRSEHLPEQHER